MRKSSARYRCNSSLRPKRGNTASTTAANTWSFEERSRSANLRCLAPSQLVACQSLGALRIPDLPRRGIPSHDRAPEVGLVRHVAGERGIVAKHDIFG